MCNRYSLSKKQERLIIREYGSLELYFMERFNIAPTQSAPVVVLENGKLVCREMKWGIETRFGTLTNTRAESTHKKTFREAFERGRCLVPADGFYEWKSGKPAQPYRIVRATRNIFYFAGLWQKGRFSIITKPARSFIRSVHERMPIILEESRFHWWLSEPFHVIAGAGGLLAQGVSETTLEAYPVTPKMTDPRFQSLEAIEPIELAQLDFLRLEIDNPDIRWRDPLQPPDTARRVLLLLNDGETVAGEWDGKDWKYRAVSSKDKPLKWRQA